MEFQDLMFERRSIRGYKPDPVPREAARRDHRGGGAEPVVDEHPAVERSRGGRRGARTVFARATPSR